MVIILDFARLLCYIVFFYPSAYKTAWDVTTLKPLRNVWVMLLKMEQFFFFFFFCRAALLALRLNRTKIVSYFVSSFSRNRRNLLKNGSISWNKAYNKYWRWVDVIHQTFNKCILVNICNKLKTYHSPKPKNLQKTTHERVRSVLLLWNNISTLWNDVVSDVFLLTSLGAGSSSLFLNCNNLFHTRYVVTHWILQKALYFKGIATITLGLSKAIEPVAFVQSKDWSVSVTLANLFNFVICIFSITNSPLAFCGIEWHAAMSSLYNCTGVGKLVLGNLEFPVLAIANVLQ